MQKKSSPEELKMKETAKEEVTDINPRELKVRLMLLGVKQCEILPVLAERMDAYVDKAYLSESLSRGATRKHVQIRIALNNILDEWEIRNKKEARRKARKAKNE